MKFNREERIGVFSVAKIFVENFEWIFREQPINDFGIDAFIEITKILSPSERGATPTGRILGAQIKSGESFFKEHNSNNYVFRGNKKHLNYWLNHSIPILIILYDKISGLAYWQEINKSNLILTEKAFKINIPKTNILSVDAKEQLERFANFKNNYEYKLWQFKSSVELINALTHHKHFLYVELSQYHFNKDYHVSILMTQEDDDYVARILHYSLQYYFFFYLKEDQSIIEGIKETLPWINLIRDGQTYSEETFSNEVLDFVDKFPTEDSLKDNSTDKKSIYSLACQMTGDYYFKLEVSPNELAYSFLLLDNFLTQDSGFNNSKKNA